MILGVDKGNIKLKTSTLYTIDSKVSKMASIMGSGIEFVMDGVKYYIGTGDYETELNKARQENFIPLLFHAIAMSTHDVENQVVCGLPMNQYKEFKDELKERILSNRIKDIEMNGRNRRIIISDVEIIPEGAAVDIEGISIDIGGRTTDCCLKRYENGRMRILNPLSYAKGTLNLYSEAAKLINSKFALDLSASDMEKIFKKGLKINGVLQDIGFVLDVFRSFVDSLVNDLRVEYSLKTEDVHVLGGGGQLLFKAIKNRIPQAELVENSLFRNAIEFERYGEQLWQ
ncbi:ParM/StbA family protein [Clostridium thermarum]|uniref:ParM/StbA family protein n=1 Tax=Clostridium thermarum TaxID=1716543 RepID=UPI001120BE0C|nr:ParM/StbA family protein [Clostridium thermarum]